MRTKLYQEVVEALLAAEEVKQNIPAEKLAELKEALLADKLPKKADLLAKMQESE